MLSIRHALGVGRRSMVRHQSWHRQRNIIKSYIRLLATAGTQSNHILNEISEHSNDGYKVSIRSSPFSRSSEQSQTEHSDAAVDYSTCALDVYPNPLFKMTKDELLSLTDQEFTHLLKIPYRVFGESDQFCLRIIEILEENVFERPHLVRKLVSNLDLNGADLNESPSKDEELIQTTVLDHIRTNLANDNLKLSILEFTLDPKSKSAIVLIKRNISSILSLKQTSPKDRGIVLLNYLKSLALTGVINTKPILISTKRYAQIISCVPPSKFMELYSYFFHINLQSEDLSVIERLKRTLITGSEIEKFVVRSGWLNPKFHHVSTYEFNDNHKQKMVSFFTIKDFQIFAGNAIKKNDVVNASLYLNLLVSKFEKKCNDYAQLSSQRVGDSDLSDDIQVVLKVTLDFLMTFKDFKTCLVVLKYLIKNDLKVELPTLITIMKNLRLQGRFEDAILIMNNIQLEGLTARQTSELVEEMLLLIKGRFPKSPKVLLGYVASFCEGGTTNMDDTEVLHFLNELKLLNLVYGDGELGTLSTFDVIQTASVDERLKGFQLSAKSLADIYDCVLGSLQREKITPQFIVDLYQSYMMVVKRGLITDSESKQSSSLIGLEVINDNVVYHLISYLLREVPHESSTFNLIKSNHNFITAKLIFQTFIKNVRVHGNQISTRLIDLLVYSSLMVHDDYKFAAEVVRFSKENRSPFTFNQIFPFITFHYRRQEYDAAKIWYDQLINSGVKSTTIQSRELWKIARQLRWETTGFTYRKWNIKKNYKAKEELARIRTDPLIFFGDQETEERVTEELINEDTTPNPTVTENHSNDSNFNAELSSVLYQIKQ